MIRHGSPRVSAGNQKVEKKMRRIVLLCSVLVSMVSNPAFAQWATEPAYDAGWFHNVPAGTITQDGYWPDPPSGPIFYAGGGGVGNDTSVIASGADEVIGSGLTAIIGGSGSEYDVTGIDATSQSEAITNGEFFAYSFTTPAMITPGTAIGLVGLADWEVNGSYSVAIDVSGVFNGNALSQTIGLVTDVTIVGGTSGDYNFSRLGGTVADTPQLLPNESYTVTVYLYNVAAGPSGTVTFDDFQIGTGVLAGPEANDDDPAAVDGTTGGTISNVVANDTLAGTTDPEIGADVEITEAVTAQDGTPLGLDEAPASGAITLDPDTGEITVAPDTSAGTYVYTYEICETLNPTRCDTAEATILIEPAPIVADDDTPAALPGNIGGTISNVVANDRLAGTTNPEIGTDVEITEAVAAQDGTPLGLAVPPASGAITLDPDTGEITVAPDTSEGTYVYTYEICETLNPTNCDTAEVTIVVQEAVELISEIEEELTRIIEEDLANTLTTQSRQISGYSADANDRLRDRNSCLADVNARLKQQNILFDTDKAIIKPQSQQVLDEITVILGSCPGTAFEIAGHTDSDASDAYNLDLSQRRVDAVLLALTARDVETTGYIARGYGESQPIASNATAAGKAQNRRVEFRSLADVEQYHGVCEDSFSLARGFNLQANGERSNADAEFLRDKHDCITDRREVFEGALSFVDTDQGQTQAAINLSYRSEKYRGSDSVFGYFVGAYASKSDVSNGADGDIRGLGFNVGIYGANRLHEELFLDYYLGAATGRHEFDLSFDRGIGAISSTGDYSYLAGFAGAALSGELTYGDTTLTPRVGFDYVYTPGADVDVLAELGALSEAGDLELDAISGGRVFAEIRTDRLIWSKSTKLWLNPRIACYQSLGSLDGDCGFGGSIGLENSPENSSLAYSIELDGEWGSDFFLGSLSMRASRQIGIGSISGGAGLNSKGDASLGANFNTEF